MNGIKQEDTGVCVSEDKDKPRNEFAKRRRILVTNLPESIDIEVS